MIGDKTITGIGMPVLNTVHDAVKKAGIPQMRRIVFVCVQHLMYSSVLLFEKLIQLGAEPNNIFLTGKHYSTCEEVSHKLKKMGINVQPLTKLKKLGEYTITFNQNVSNMWKNVQDHISHVEDSIDGVVVLDDGGRCLEFIAKGILNNLPVIGIEQTTAGLFNPAVMNMSVPFIDVAACAAKIHLEPSLIVLAILSKIEKILPQEGKNLRCGVVGLGVIGKVLTKKLVLSGYNVFVFDNNEKMAAELSGVHFCAGIDDLFKKANYIFGCTGRDITADLNIDEFLNENKTFLSCSSEDKEFLSLLKMIQNSVQTDKIQDPLKNIIFECSNGNNLVLIKGGFPVNFDDTGESAVAEKIQLTRGLLLTSLIQAVITMPLLMNGQLKGRVMLHPECQRFVVKEWLKFNKINRDHKNDFTDINWVIKNSMGSYYPSTYLSKCFASYEVMQEKTSA
jgi:S-adenosylhomocysteine hydrolase